MIILIILLIIFLNFLSVKCPERVRKRQFSAAKAGFASSDFQFAVSSDVKKLHILTTLTQEQGSVWHFNLKDDLNGKSIIRSNSRCVVLWRPI